MQQESGPLLLYCCTTFRQHTERGGRCKARILFLYNLRLAVVERAVSCLRRLYYCCTICHVAPCCDVAPCLYCRLASRLWLAETATVFQRFWKHAFRTITDYCCTTTNTTVVLLRLLYRQGNQFLDMHEHNSQEQGNYSCTVVPSETGDFSTLLETCVWYYDTVVLSVVLLLIFLYCFTDKDTDFGYARTQFSGAGQLLLLYRRKQETNKKTGSKARGHP